LKRIFSRRRDVAEVVGTTAGVLRGLLFSPLFLFDIRLRPRREVKQLPLSWRERVDRPRLGERVAVFVEAFDL